MVCCAVNAGQATEIRAKLCNFIKMACDKNFYTKTVSSNTSFNTYIIHQQAINTCSIRE